MSEGATVTTRHPDPIEFVQCVQRMQSSGNAPIALMGAGSYVKKLCPTAFVQPGMLVGIIDDDRAKQGKEWAGLPVMSAAEAIRKGVKGVIVTAYGEPFTKLWAQRGELRDAGVYMLSCPAAFETKGWDDCLIEQYEYAMGSARGKPGIYARIYPPEKPVAWEWLLNPLQERVKQGMTVLEVGSGTGLWTQHLIERAAKYHAVDYAPRLLFEAIDHRFASHRKKLHLHHDEHALLGGVPDASVDVAFSYDVFVHLKSDLVHQYLESMKRVLRPNGKILLHFVTWNETALKTWKQKFHEGLRGRGDEMHYNTLDCLRTSAASLGMRVEQVGPTVGWGYLAEFSAA